MKKLQPHDSHSKASSILMSSAPPFIWGALLSTEPESPRPPNIILTPTCAHLWAVPGLLEAPVLPFLLRTHFPD